MEGLDGVRAPLGGAPGRASLPVSRKVHESWRLWPGRSLALAECTNRQYSADKVTDPPVQDPEFCPLPGMSNPV